MGRRFESSRGRHPFKRLREAKGRTRAQGHIQGHAKNRERVKSRETCRTKIARGFTASLIKHSSVPWPSRRVRPSAGGDHNVSPGAFPQPRRRGITARRGLHFLVSALSALIGPYGFPARSDHTRAYVQPTWRFAAEHSDGVEHSRGSAFRHQIPSACPPFFIWKCYRRKTKDIK